MAYTIVGGDAVYPSDVPYQKIELDGDISLSWPSSFPTGYIASGFSKVTPTTGGFSISLPDTTLGSIGATLTFGNFGSDDFYIYDYDGNNLYTMTPGLVMDFKLDDNATAAGSWIILPISGNFTGITTLNIQSANDSVKITDGSVTPPGGVVDLQLPDSITNISLLTTSGLVSVDDEGAAYSVSLVAGNNITISNPDGVSGDPTIAVSSTPSNFTSLGVGSLTMTGNSISSSSSLNLNSVAIDSSQNITNVNTITATNVNATNITGSITSSYIIVGAVGFVDGLSGISITKSVGNISSVTRVGTGRYRVNFSSSMPNNTYILSITEGTNVTNLPSVLPNVYQAFCTTKNQNYFDLVMLDASGSLIDAEYGIDITVL